MSTGKEKKIKVIATTTTKYFPPTPFPIPFTPQVWELGLPGTAKRHLHWEENVNRPKTTPFHPQTNPRSLQPPLYDATQRHSHCSQFLARTWIPPPHPGSPGPGAVFWGRNPQFEGKIWENGINARPEAAPSSSQCTSEKPTFLPVYQ